MVVGPPLDLMEQDSVRSFAASLDKSCPKLDILVNNAGVAFMKRCMTGDGIGGIAQVGPEVEWEAAGAWGVG